jgi:hypothetical protein
MQERDAFQNLYRSFQVPEGIRRLLMLHISSPDRFVSVHERAAEHLTRLGSLGVVAAGLMAILVSLL